MVIILNLLIGFISGIAAILPGISASSLLLLFGKYDEILENIYNLTKKPIKSIKYLTPLAIGIIIGAFLLSNILQTLLNKYTSQISIIFIILILGTIPGTINNITKKDYNKNNLIYFLISFILGITLLIFKNNILINVNNINIIYIFFMGILLSLSTIIPGISTTIIFNIFNFYNIYLNAISTINLKILLPLFISFLITTFILSKLLTKLFNKHYAKTYFTILGFTISTIPSLIFEKITINIPTIISIFIGIAITYIINKALKNKINN